jgi:hypothetical protein
MTASQRDARFAAAPTLTVKKKEKKEKKQPPGTTARRWFGIRDRMAHSSYPL